MLLTSNRESHAGSGLSSTYEEIIGRAYRQRGKESLPAIGARSSRNLLKEETLAQKNHRKNVLDSKAMKKKVSDLANIMMEQDLLAKSRKKADTIESQEFSPE